MHPVLDSGLYPQPLNHPHFPALHHPAMSAAADTASLYHHHHPQQQNQQQHLQNFPPDPYSQQHSNYVSSAVLEASSMYSAENYQPIHGSTLATSISTSKPQITKSNTKSSPTTSVPVFPSPPAAASIKFDAANSPNNSILATSTTTTSTKSALDSTLEFPQQQSASGKLINTSKNLRNVAAQQQTTSSSSSLLSANNSAVAAAYYAAAIANPDTTTSTNFYSSGNHYFNGTDSLIPEGLPLPPYYPTNPGMMMQGMYGIGPDELMNISPLYAGSGLSSSTAHLHYESESSGSYVGGCSSWPQYYMESSSIPLTNERVVIQVAQLWARLALNFCLLTWM
uniref:Uncharacterized protein n=1 Tax=Ditylenchus dipsaci TaxID=166011 RepID=A0A915CV18_9BILA